MDKQREDSEHNKCEHCANSLGISADWLELVRKQRHDLPPEEQVMSANAYLLVRDVEAGDEFLLLGCDGIWDTKTTQEIVDFVRQRLPEVWEADCLEPQVLAGFPRL